MIKKILSILLPILFVAGLLIFLKPYLVERETTRIIKEILKAWQDNDFSHSFIHWKDKNLAPPIYGLKTYDILKKVYPKDAPIPTAFFLIKLNFPDGNLLPNGEDWLFKLQKAPRIGWQVIDCYILKSRGEDPQNKLPESLTTEAMDVQRN